MMRDVFRVVKLEGQIVPVLVVGRDDRLDRARVNAGPVLAGVNDAVLTSTQLPAQGRHSVENEILRVEL